mgnify:CR=1 FL=1
MPRFRWIMTISTEIPTSIVWRDLGTNRCKKAKCKQLRISIVLRDLGANSAKSGDMELIANQYSEDRFEHEFGTELGSQTGRRPALESLGFGARRRARGGLAAGCAPLPYLL